MSGTPSYTIKIPPHRVEWPTVILAVAIYGGFLALTFWWQSLPVAVVALAGGWLIAWQGSLQHEVIHGHPTGNQRINDAIGSIPLSLWLPYPIYRESHLEHHRDEHLTDPIEDPDPPMSPAPPGERLGRTGRLLARWNTTLLGRLTIGPAVMLVSFLAQEARLLRADEPGRARVWTVHIMGVAAVLFG